MDRPILTFNETSIVPSEASHIRAAEVIGDSDEICATPVLEDLPDRLHRMIVGGTLDPSETTAVAISNGMTARVALPTGQSLAFSSFKFARDLDGKVYRMSDAQARAIGEAVIGAILKSDCAASQEARQFYETALVAAGNG